MTYAVNRSWLYWYQRTPDSPMEYYGQFVCKWPDKVAMWRMLVSKARFDNLHRYGFVEIPADKTARELLAEKNRLCK